MNKTRLIIFAKDIQLITGMSLRHAQRILQQIRLKHNKKKGQFVTVAEFAAHVGLTVEEVLNKLQN